MTIKLNLIASAILLGLNSSGVYAAALVNNHKVQNKNTQFNTIESITVLGKAATEDADLGGISLKELPANTHVVGRAEIERLRFVGPNEFLDRIPGETQVRNLRIPDGGKSYTIPMLDGMPLESPYEGATQRLDRTNTSDIQRVEIIKGPASALYANNAFGGVVNVVSRDAPNTPETKISVEAGDFNRLRAGINTGGKVNNIGYFFDLNTRNLEGLRDLSQNDRDQASGKLIFHPSDITRISTRFEYLDETVIARGDLTAEQMAEDPTQAGGLSSSTDLQQNAISVKVDHLTESGKIEAQLVRREKDTIGESRFSGPQDENDLAYNGKLMYRHDLDSADIVVGLDRYDSSQNVKQYARGDASLSGTFTPYTNELSVNAYFGQYQIHATEQITLTAGLRHEDIKLSSSLYSQNASFSDTSPKLGVTYQLSPDNMLWLGISEGFYAPNMGHLFDMEDGNPDLKSEEARNIEMGFRGSWKNWHYDTSIYQNKISNYLVTQEFVRVVDEQEQEYQLTTNAGKVDIKGIETVIEYAPKDAQWRAGLTHTFTDNTYDSFVQSTPGADDDLSGKVLRRSPDHHLNMRVAWLPMAGLSAELEADMYSHYFADAVNSPESKFTRGDRINLRINYEFAQWRVWFHGLNLTDTMEDRATYSRGRMTFRTIDGRTFYAGVSYTF
ncbi:TonB-dependent receptor [Paraglaciecola aquimarina]|uniref:TonB-dependent receptor n=1 Tax=Paraglaciecola algarum TaxID=3050085 RepID=A0ABS9D8Q0_9ALTE|nr:TonB-dependent receptor [Paraglaciecola sp. G1-23]MCF2948767.1 TonB-dependent receptor [Paraglaciecola sp. G1-23]